MAKLDRRHAIRFDLQLKCRVFSPFRAFSDFSGVTANMSRTGVLVHTDAIEPDQRMPTVGNAARIVFELPRNAAVPPKCLDCEATVVRIDALENGSWEYGFRIRRIQFRDLGELSRAMVRFAGADTAIGYLQ